jgi:hypothetical protein
MKINILLVSIFILLSYTIQTCANTKSTKRSNQDLNQFIQHNFADETIKTFKCVNITNCDECVKNTLCIWVYKTPQTSIKILMNNLTSFNDKEVEFCWEGGALGAAYPTFTGFKNVDGKESSFQMTYSFMDFSYLNCAAKESSALIAFLIIIVIIIGIILLVIVCAVIAVIVGVLIWYFKFYKNRNFKKFNDEEDTTKQEGDNELKEAN